MCIRDRMKAVEKARMIVAKEHVTSHFAEKHRGERKLDEQQHERPDSIVFPLSEPRSQNDERNDCSAEKNRNQEKREW